MTITAKRYRSRQEMIDYFKQLAFDFEGQAHREKSEFKRGKAEAYELAAFELEHNLEPVEERKEASCI